MSDPSTSNNSGTDSSSINDKAIVANLFLSTGVGFGLFLLYCGIRKFFQGVYSPNLTSADHPKWPAAKNGHFSWMQTTYQTSDSELLAIVGLEAYVFLQAMKLMAGIILSIFIPVCVILLPAYALTGGGELLPDNLDDSDGVDITGSNVFYRLSILNASTNFLWLPFLVSYLVALLVLYVVYLFYRNYILLRQAYLKKPSALSGALTLKRFGNLTGSIEDARRIINVQTRAVLLTGVSHKYDKSRLWRLLDDTGMGPINSLTFINDRTELAKIVKKRNEAIVNLEKSLQHMFKEMVKNGMIQGLTKPKDLDQFLWQEHIELPITLGERIEILTKILDPSFCPEYRPKISKKKTKKNSRQEEEITTEESKEAKKVDAISYYHQQLIELEQQYMKLLANNGNQSDVYGKSRDLEMRKAASSPLGNHTTLVSFRKFTLFSHNLKDFKLTMWGTSQSAIAIFSDAKAAAAVSQSVLSRQLFSMRSQKAPGSDDLLWDNLYVPAADRRLRQIAGDLMYVLLILLFANITAALTIVTDLDKLSVWLPFLQDLPPRVHSLLQGVMAPLAYNIALALVPLALRAIATYQGKTAKSEVENSILRKLSWFYFIQSFVVVMLARSVVDLVAFVAKRNWGPLLQAFRESLVSKSSFFFNLVVQRAFLSSMILLIRVDGLLMAIVKLASALNWTPRQYADNSKSEPFLYGNNYANYGTSLFQITLAFVMITPLTLIPGLVYFVITYFIFRHQLLYSFMTNHESGGLYWRRAVPQILFALVISQLFTTAHFALRGNVWIAVGMLPLLAFTAVCMSFFKNAFDVKTTYRPLSFEDEQLVDEVIKEVEQHQDRLVQPDKDVLSTIPEVEEEELADEMKEKKATEERQIYYGDLAHQELIHVPVRQLVGHVEEGISSSPTTVSPTTTAAGPSTTTTSTAESSDYFDMDIIGNPYKNPVLFRRYPSIILPPLFLLMVKYLTTTTTNREPTTVTPTTMENE